MTVQVLCDHCERQIGERIPSRDLGVWYGGLTAAGRAKSTRYRVEASGGLEGDFCSLTCLAAWANEQLSGGDAS